MRARRRPLGETRLGPDRSHGVDICQGVVQIPHRGADELTTLLHLVEDQELGLHRGAELAIHLPRDRQREAWGQEPTGTCPMRGITLGAEPRRHNRHQPPPGREALRGSDEMLGRDVFVSGAIDR